MLKLLFWAWAKLVLVEVVQVVPKKVRVFGVVREMREFIWEVARLGWVVCRKKLCFWAASAAWGWFGGKSYTEGLNEVYSVGVVVVVDVVWEYELDCGAFSSPLIEANLCKSGMSVVGLFVVMEWR